MNKAMVEKILRFYRDIPGELALNQRLHSEVNSWYDPLGAVNFDQSGKAKNKITSSTETTALNIPADAAAELDRLQKEREELTALRNAIRLELGKLGYQQRLILHSFYIERHNWEFISSQINYSVRHCKNLRDGAIARLAVLFTRNPVVAAYKFPV